MNTFIRFNYIERLTTSGIPQLFTYGLLFLTLPCVSFAANLPVGLYAEDFLHDPYISMPAISPDGQHVACIISENNLQTIQVIDIATGDQQTLKIPDLKHSHFNHLQWLNNDRLAYQVNSSDIYAQNRDSSGLIQIFNASRVVRSGDFIAFQGKFAFPRIIAQPLDQPDKLLISTTNDQEKREVYAVNIHDGSSELVQPGYGSIRQWLTDPKGIIRAGVSYNGQKVDFLYRDNERQSWTSLDKYFGTDKRTRFSYTGSSLISQNHLFLGFDYDPHTLYFVSNLLGEEETKILLAYDMENPAIARKLVEDPRYDVIADLEGNTRLYYSKVRKKLVGIQYYRDKLTSVWFDSTFQSIQKNLDKHLPKTINLILDSDISEQTFLVFSYSDRITPAYYVFNLENEIPGKLAGTHPWLDDKELARTKVINYRSRDDLMIEGYLTFSARLPDHQKQPLLVLLHGGPWKRDYFTFNPAVQYLAWQGYAVLQINYRGSTGYGFEHFDAARKNYGTGSINDIIDGVLYVLDHERIDPDRIGLMGPSFGGLAAMLCLAEEPDLFHCGISLSAPTDLVQSARNLRDKPDSGLAYDAWAELVGGYWSDREKLILMSPIHRAADFEDPLLLIHGLQDYQVPYSQTRDLIQHLRQNNKDFELIVIDDEGHELTRTRNRVMVFEKIAEFLHQHMPSDIPYDPFW